MAYEASLKSKWDTQNAFDYGIKVAAEKAAKEATEKERAKAEEMLLASAKSLKEAGVSSSLISSSLKLPLDVVEKL